MTHELPERFGFVSRMKKYEGNPIIRPQGEVAADLIFNPTAVVHNGKVGLLCRAVNLADKVEGENWSISSLIWAWSDDGIHFKLDDEPFLKPDKDSPYKGGFEDPRIAWIEDEELWVLTYTGVKEWFPGAKSSDVTPGLIAYSRDLKTWEFGGEKFPARAVAIVPRKIDGKYYAYYGNSSLFSTWSYDLREWHTEMKPVISPRAGKFDSSLCEAAAAPIYSDEGILLLYNGATTFADKVEYANRIRKYQAKNTGSVYSVGWVLLDPKDPERVLARADEPFIAPVTPDESYGLVGYTIFASGLVNFRGKYHLYYGCNDTRIGVAIEE